MGDQNTNQNQSKSGGDAGAGAGALGYANPLRGFANRENVI